jgi:hypothetical protein
MHRPHTHKSISVNMYCIHSMSNNIENHVLVSKQTKVIKVCMEMFNIKCRSATEKLQFVTRHTIKRFELGKFTT